MSTANRVVMSPENSRELARTELYKAISSKLLVLSHVQAIFTAILVITGGILGIVLYKNRKAIQMLERKSLAEVLEISVVVALVLNAVSLLVASFAINKIRPTLLQRAALSFQVTTVTLALQVLVLGLLPLLHYGHSVYKMDDKVPEFLRNCILTYPLFMMIAVLGGVTIVLEESLNLLLNARLEEVSLQGNAYRRNRSQHGFGIQRGNVIVLSKVNQVQKNATTNTKVELQNQNEAAFTGAPSSQVPVLSPSSSAMEPALSNKKVSIQKVSPESDSNQNKTDKNLEATGSQPSSKKLIHSCTECGKSFRHKSYFDYHMRTHFGERPHKCHVCPKSFFERSKLNRHLDACHQIKNSSYLISQSSREDDKASRTCTQCHKTFTRQSGLQAHLRTHSKIRPFACPHPNCGDKFSGQTALKNHEMIAHVNVKNVMCDICGKTFTLKKYLDLHMNTTHRMGIRQYKCQKCPKEFHSAKDLKRHTLSHSNEKRFACNQCKACFKRKDNFNRHLRLTHLLTSDQTEGEGGGEELPATRKITEDNPAEKAMSNLEPSLNKSSVTSLGQLSHTSNDLPPTPTPLSRQVSVIKSTHEFIMAITRGQDPNLSS